jgi:alcohol dehydrogenase (NADP+)
MTQRLKNFCRHKKAVFAIEESLDELQLDYLDLFLIHWPHDNADFNPSFDHIDTWKEMQKVVRTSKGSRFIGVSNFGNKMIEDILKLDGIKPVYNEIELHPYLPQHDVVAFNQKNNITLIGYAPLANTQASMNMGISVDRNAVPPILKTELVTSIAQARGCTPAQVVLAWNLHRGVVVIPKAIQSSHQTENIATLDKCKITDDDFAKVNTIKESIRFYLNACEYMPEGCELAKKHATKNDQKPPSRIKRNPKVF